MLASGEGKTVGLRKKSRWFNQPRVQSEKRGAVAERGTPALCPRPHYVSLSQNLSERRHLTAPRKIRGGPELRQRWDEFERQ